MPDAPTRRHIALALATALLVPLAAACGAKDTAGTGTGADTQGSPPAAPADLTVLAAASLTEVFKAVGAAYEDSHPGTKVTFSFAGSQALAAQVKQGAPADVLVTADTKTMDGLRKETNPTAVIAKNRLVIATAKGNPHRINEVKDLVDARLKVVLAAPEVPVGRYSKKVLDAQNLTVHPVSLEPNVRAVLSKVEWGEADAGLVYRTDVAAAKGKVTEVQIPDASNVVAQYPAATLKTTKNPGAATAFVSWLTTPPAQRIMLEAGFQSP
ncbi:molybdate ABC transporter substrate-binding protein [Streptomyces sp. NPDC006879]|uniref:molybdate ABC transporter substrate-binding protein n=1 Tax=Streptomyces sp. NPDC006879 TaxID=3364767 RepID=UPI00368477D7